MSFYRTYRPQVIDEIDNTHVREQMSSLLKKERSELPHAYLLTGPKGSGKTTAARILAKLYLCSKLKKKSGPCGVCESCISIARGTNMDVLEIDAASNRGIDEIRELRDRIALAPVGGEYKIYIIDEVHMLTPEAFNALLKTLEEPPKHAVFVLATTDQQKIPATIKSRCIAIPFRKATQEELISALKKIVAKESITIEDDALAFIATESDGAFRDAVKVLEQVSFSKKKITIDFITDLLSTSDSGERKRFIEAISAKDEKSALAVIELLVSETKDIKGFIVDILRDLQESLVNIGKGQTILGWDRMSIQHVMKCLIDAYGLMKTSPIPEIPIELAVMEYCTGPVTPVSEVTPKIVVPDFVKEVKKTVEANDESFTVEKLVECWKDVIESLKPFNHSVAGVLRGAHPKRIENGIVTIETQYKFHQERLSEMKVRDMLSTVFKKLFGVQVRVEVVLGEK
ncbi:MAG: DNA polymerase III subunit gamma/tau [Candidatus Gottesmanbacteria bacterium]